MSIHEVYELLSSVYILRKDTLWAIASLNSLDEDFTKKVLNIIKWMPC